MWHHGLSVSYRFVSCYYSLEMVIQLRDDAFIMIDMIMLVHLRYDIDGWSC
jgi:hypothetical protein